LLDYSPGEPDFPTFLEGNTVMKKNVGSADRIVRIVAALAIGLLLIFNVLTGPVGTVLGIVAIVFLATGAISFCPLYLPLGLSTNKKADATK
jgi:hypothetical protein